MAILEKKCAATHALFNGLRKKTPGNISIKAPTNELKILSATVPGSTVSKNNLDIICLAIELNVPRGTLMLNPSHIVAGLRCNNNYRQNIL